MRKPNTAVVILGVSGVGKDTLASQLVNFSTPFLNFEVVKFAEPVKRAIAAYLGVSMSQMEDREYRTKPIAELDGLSILDILVKSFDVMPQLHPKLGLVWARKALDNLQYCGVTPVFTDVRNLVEVELILSRNYDRLFVVELSSRVRGKALSSDRCIQYIRNRLAVNQNSRFFGMYNNGLSTTDLDSKARYLVKAIEAEVINYGR